MLSTSMQHQPNQKQLKWNTQQQNPIPLTHRPYRQQATASTHHMPRQHKSQTNNQQLLYRRHHTRKNHRRQRHKARVKQQRHLQPCQLQRQRLPRLQAIHIRRHLCKQQIRPQRRPIQQQNTALLQQTQLSGKQHQQRNSTKQNTQRHRNTSTIKALQQTHRPTHQDSQHSQPTVKHTMPIRNERTQMKQI